MWNHRVIVSEYLYNAEIDKLWFKIKTVNFDNFYGAVMLLSISVFRSEPTLESHTGFFTSQDNDFAYYFTVSSHRTGNDQDT